MNDKIVCVVGVGYVGLPLAEAFTEHLTMISTAQPLLGADELEAAKEVLGSRVKR